MVKERESNLSPKPFKIEETVDDQKEDRISALPDCLIVQILSFLPSTKDAIKTGTLSKSWKSLWTSIPTLIFKHSGYNQPTFNFVSFVNNTLTKCRHSKLNKFEIAMEYHMRFESQVNYWIRYAISRNVEQLQLTLYNFDSDDRCVLDEQFFTNSCFTHLKLQSCIFKPNGAISWNMLRSLSISYAYLDEDLIKHVLSGSPILETLVLEFCYGYKRLDITSMSVKNFVFCGYHNPTDNDGPGDIIEINAPNILSLKIQSVLVLWKFLLVDVSSLIEAELDYRKFGYWETTRKEAKDEMLKGFLRSLHNVKKLKVVM